MTNEDYFSTRFKYSDSKAKLWETITDYISRQTELSGHVLDAGAGYCYFANAVLKYADRVTAVDQSAHPLTYANDSIKTREEKIQNLSVEAGTVDVVFVSNVLEHLPRDSITAALNTFRRVLRPDGTLVVVTPNIALVGGNYWNDYTHETPITLQSLHDWARVEGFHSRYKERRFLPFSSDGILPASELLLRVYLHLPSKARPLAGQSLLIADRA